MPGSAVPLGPFTGGLNQLDDPRLISDNQLTVCQNLDLTKSGALSSRPGLAYFTKSANIFLIGTVLLSNNTTRAFYRPATNIIYYSDGETNILNNATWTSTGAATPQNTVKVVQATFGGVVYAYFVPNGSGAVGMAQNLSTNGLSTISGMPKGSGAVIFKDRLFIFGPVDTAAIVSTQRVYYSDPGDFTTWGANSYFDINPGDGEGVTAAFATSDSIVFFKRHSTYAFYFDSDPKLGTLRKINAQIGATGANSVTQFENSIYVTDERTVYRIQNLLFTDIGKNLNLKVKRKTVTFSIDTNADFMYVFGSRILCAIYTGPADGYKYYVYHSDNDAWTEYVFAEQPERFFKVVAASNFEFLISSKVGSARLYQFSPFDNGSQVSDLPSNVVAIALKTKSYDFGVSSAYKRLFWWGLDFFLPGYSALNWQVTLTATAFDVNTSAASSVTLDYLGFFVKAFTPGRGRYYSFMLTANTRQISNILSGTAFVAVKEPVYAQMSD